MPILAVPYLMPYVQLAGIAIGGLGLMEVSKRVQVHMEENPEESLRILKLIMPREGIASMFEELFNERGDDDELDEKEAVKGREEEVDFDEEEIIDIDKPKSKKSKKEIVLEEVRRYRRGKGNYASPDAEGPAISGRGNVRRGLEDAGKIPKDIHSTYDKSKKYQGYKRFIRGRTHRKADGGIMDVL